jgi:hypothetical protein
MYCKVCNSEIINYNSKDYCSKDCRYKQHSIRIKKLHQSGETYTKENNYLVSFYNGSELHKLNASKNAINRYHDKSSKGSGSEYQYRIMNCECVKSKVRTSQELYLYVVKFNTKIKVGITSVLQRRISWELIPDEILLIVKGSINNIAELERDTLIEFISYTLYDNDKWSEFLSDNCTSELIKYISNVVKSSETIEIVNIQEIEL